MKATSGLACAVTLLLATACEGEKPPPEVKFSDETVKLAEGMITLRVPAGWRRVSADGQPIEYDAERYATSGERWASCTFDERVLPNFQGAPQSQLNDANRMMPSPSLAGANPVDEAYELVGEVSFKTIRVTASHAQTHMRHAIALAGGEPRGLFLACEIAQPVVAQDKAEIDAFLGSATFSRPS